MTSSAVCQASLIQPTRLFSGSLPLLRRVLQASSFVSFDNLPQDWSQPPFRAQPSNGDFKQWHQHHQCTQTLPFPPQQLAFKPFVVVVILVFLEQTTQRPGHKKGVIPFIRSGKIRWDIGTRYMQNLPHLCRTWSRSPTSSAGYTQLSHQRQENPHQDDPIHMQ